jgi:hypothetical protein
MSRQFLTTQDVDHRGDLLDRALLAMVPHFPAERRQRQETFQPAFTEVRPRTLSALVDRPDTALRWVPAVRHEWLSGLADFARLTTAAEQASAVPPGAGARRTA